MGFIQTPVKKIMKRKLPNTESLRKARAEHEAWLKERGLHNLKARIKPRTAPPIAKGITLEGSSETKNRFQVHEAVKVTKINKIPVLFTVP